MVTQHAIARPHRSVAQPGLPFACATLPFAPPVVRISIQEATAQGWNRRPHQDQRPGRVGGRHCQWTRRRGRRQCRVLSRRRPLCRLHQRAKAARHRYTKTTKPQFQRTTNPQIQERRAIPTHPIFPQHRAMLAGCPDHHMPTALPKWGIVIRHSCHSKQRKQQRNRILHQRTFPFASNAHSHSHP